jgi:hypothetical protein
MLSKGIRERPGRPKRRDRGSCYHEENVKESLREVQDDGMSGSASLNYDVMPKIKTKVVGQKDGR